MEKKTPLYDEHVALGGKIVPFGGYLLPVQYKDGILKEHKAVRETAGLFDVSHMGEITVRGKDALPFLNYLLTNDFSGLETGRIRYSPMCYADGGTVDDLLVYKLGEDDYLLCVNASNKDKDYAHIKEQVSGDVEVQDVSSEYCQIALQGPNSVEILKQLTDESNMPKIYYSFTQNKPVAGVHCIISKTGYTGEDGFELYAPAKDAIKLWNAILEAGADYALYPCGLGCRDTLRLEAGMPLYGHELSAEITPKEANLSMFVKLEKEDFIGKEKLDDNRKRKRIGLVLTDRGIARDGAIVFANGKEVGIVTSGTSSPTLQKSIAMALVDATVEDEANFEIEVRGKKLQAQKVKLPFYKRG